jgi:hypothetical protein
MIADVETRLPVDAGDDKQVLYNYAPEYNFICGTRFLANLATLNLSHLLFSILFITFISGFK